jgi:hypothetical protein
MKAYWGNEIIAHTFLTSVLNGDEWSGKKFKSSLMKIP